MQALLREGIRLSAAGWNVMMMRRGIEQAMQQALGALRALARPIKSEADVSGLALAAGGDPRLAALLGEMFDTLGSDGIVQVQQGFKPGIEHDYIEGAFWDSGWITPSMATDEMQREARLTDPYVLIAPDHIENWEDIAPILNAVADKGRSLFIIALNVGATALNLLLSNREKTPSAAVKAPAWGDHQENLLQDIAVLTGTRVMLPKYGERLRDLRLEEMGQARSVVVNRDYFGLVGGHGDPKLLRERIAGLRTQIKNGVFKEGEDLTHARERLAKLSGGVGVIYVGGVTEADTAERRENVERCVSTVKHAQSGGIVPGGGMAYIECARAMRSLSLPRAEAVGVEILTRALEEPLRALAANAGFDPSPIAARAQEQPSGWGFNALSGQFEDLWAAKIVDPLPVVETALTHAVSGALMALTTSTTIHRRNPPLSVEP
jgi:chaperonin GroEL